MVSTFNNRTREKSNEGKEDLNNCRPTAVKRHF